MNEKNDRFPKCQYMHGSCFAYLGGVCLLLTSTRFKGRDDCPFFKNKEDGKAARSLLLQDLNKMCEKMEV